MKNQKGISLFTIIIILGIISGLAVGFAYYSWWKHQQNIIKQGEQSKEQLEEIQKEKMEEKAKELQKEEEERQKYMENQLTPE
jgi:uncharacterized protein HemX